LAPTVDTFGRTRANVVTTAGTGEDELLVYSHLDTSLTGDPDADEPLTGRADPLVASSSDGDELCGHGLAVARAPAAAAAVGVMAAAQAMDAAGVAHRSTLLLAAGGTHHREPVLGAPAAFGVGARHALATRPLPAAVLVAKSGPPVVLHEEPGSAYVDVELRGEMRPAFGRDDTDAGVPGHLAVVLTAIERWRRVFVARPARGQIGREVAVGAVRAGVPEKCDLLPAVARLSVFVVLGHGDVAPQVAGELEHAVAAVLPADGGVTVTATAAVWEPAGATPANAPIVAALRQASGLGVDIRGWRGSTDGTVFRGLGIDTARWGPAITADPADPRRDRVELDVVVDAACVYADAIVRFASGR
jgi:acetylornithine deacetylase/succinyl-diaminopimelate desuccinylase-like protein